jgi:hypothetical protein
MRRGLVAALTVSAGLWLAAPAWAFSCGAMYLQDVLDDPAVVSVVEARRVLTAPGLIPGVSGGRDVVEPLTGWGARSANWARPSAEGSFVYPECLEVSQATTVLIVQRELEPGPNLVDATAITDELRQSLDTRFGTRVEAATDHNLVPAVLAATWQWIALVTAVIAIALDRTVRRKRTAVNGQR